MINYKIKFKTSADKEFRKLPPLVKQRIRVGDYRIVFTIDDNEKMIKITRIRHRQDVYEK